MINFKYLMFENACSYLDRTTIQLDRPGLYLIIGNNRDEGGSNESGKSNIFKLLTYGLYLTTYEKYTISDLINWDAEKDFFVETSFDYKQSTYIIQHAKKHSNQDIAILKDGKNLLQNKKDRNKEFKEILSKVVPIPIEAFFGTVMFPQDYTSFILSSATTYMDTLAGVLKLDILDTIYSDIKKQCSELSAKKNSFEVDEEEYLEIECKLETINPSSLTTQQKNYKNILSKMENSLTSLYEERACFLEQERLKTESQKSLLTEEAYKKAENTLLELKQEKDSLSKLMPLIEQLKNIRNQYSLLKEEIQPTQKYDEEYIAKINSFFDILDKLVCISESLPSTLDSSECPLCGSKISFNSIKERINNIQQNYSLIKEEQINLKKYSTYIEEKERFLEQISLLEASLPNDYTNIELQLEKINSNINVISNILIKHDNIFKLLKKLKKENIRSEEVINKDIEIILQNRQKYIDDLACIESSLIEYRLLMDKMNIYKERQKDIQQINKRIYSLSYIEDAFSRRGVRKSLLLSASTAISDMMTYLARDIYPSSMGLEFKTIEIGKNNDICLSILRRLQNGKMREEMYKLLSGGARRMTDILYLLATRKVFPEIADIEPTNILILDEPWANTDSLKRDAILQILRKTVDTQNISIFITSHEKDILQSGLFDGVFIAEKKNGKTRLVYS